VHIANKQLKGMSFCVENPNNAQCKKNFEAAFGTNYAKDPKAQVTVKNTINAMKGPLPIKKQLDRSPLTSNNIAYVPGDGTRRKAVNLTPGFTADRLTAHDRAGTLIHEASHLHGDTSDTFSKPLPGPGGSKSSDKGQFITGTEDTKRKGPISKAKNEAENAAAMKELHGALLGEWLCLRFGLILMVIPSIFRVGPREFGSQS
jgi:hypothetical protein